MRYYKDILSIAMHVSKFSETLKMTVRIGRKVNAGKIGWRLILYSLIEGENYFRECKILF